MNENINSRSKISMYPQTLLPRFFYTIASIFLVVCTLYFAKVVLLPLVTAFLLTFILAPLVGYLQSKGLPRFLSVAIVVGMVLVFVVGIFLAIISQLNGLAVELPKYKDQIISKINSIRDIGEGSLPDSFQGLIKDISKTFSQNPKSPATDGKTTVQVTMESSSLPAYQSIMGSTLEIVLTGALILLLVIFMLMNRENLRNRLIRLLGPGHLAKTINALDDSSKRVSNYLLMQLLINITFGIFLAAGLFLIGVPYALIWGFTGTLLRYIPYLGPIVAASFPLIVSWAVFPTWMPLFLVGGYFLLLEMTCGNFLEPYFYGRSVGVSEVALLIMAVFWAWLWGPFGLVLSIPLTAIIVVVGRHFPQMKVIDILLGDKAVIEPPMAFYQRLLDNDRPEATDIVLKYLKEHVPENVYEDLFIPAIINLKREKKRGAISSEEELIILKLAREILVEAVFPVQESLWVEKRKSGQNAENPPKVLVYGLASDEEEELALEMYKETLDPEKYQFQILPTTLLLSEMLTKIDKETPACVVIGSFGKSPRNRVTLKKIRQKNGEVQILMALWNSAALSHELIRWQNAGANQVGTSFKEITSRLGEARQMRPVPC